MKKIYVGKGKEFVTIKEFMSKVSELGDDITVVLGDETYYIDEPMCFSGNQKIVFEGSENTVISGGVKITGWEKLEGSDIWAAKSPVENFRRLYVNGKTATRARSKGLLSGDFYENKSTMRINVTKLPEIKSDPASVELVWEKAMWRHCRHSAETMQLTEADKYGNIYMIIGMQEPYYSWGREMGGGDKFTPSPGNPFYMENALGFMTDEGDWCLDRKAQTVYYKPRKDEDMSNISIVAPKSEGLVKIIGRELDDKAGNIVFKNISFMHSAWNHPTDKGFSSIQAQMLNASPTIQALSEKDYVKGAIELDFAENIEFYNCKFSLLGGDAIRTVNGVENITVKDCRFEDISSGAFQIGQPEHQMDKSCNKYLNRNIKIENNYIASVANEFPSSPAIMAYFAADTVIRGNEIFDVPYTGISFGWGWANPVEEVVCKNNLIEYNCIHDFMKILCDGGGVYTLGRQENCVIRYNYFYNIVNYHASVYTDNGSTNVEVYGNVNENVRHFDFSWEPTITNISVHHNYTDACCSLMDATTSEMYSNYYFQKGFMCDEACDIVAKCGTGHNIPKKGVKGLKFDTDYFIEKNEKYKSIGFSKDCSMQGITFEFEEKRELNTIFFDLYDYHQPRIVTAYLVSDEGEFIKAGMCYCPENAGHIVLRRFEQFFVKEMVPVKKLLLVVETDFNNGMMPIKNIVFM